MKRKNCVVAFGALGRLVSAETVCTENLDHHGACIGDNGGPLVAADNTLAGLYSWGPGLCGGGKPDVFTRVFPYLQFIKENLK